MLSVSPCHGILGKTMITTKRKKLTADLNLLYFFIITRIFHTFLFLFEFECKRTPYLSPPRDDTAVFRSVIRLSYGCSIHCLVMYYLNSQILTVSTQNDFHFSALLQNPK
jgi:hypothetical protein